MLACRLRQAGGTEIPLGAGRLLVEYGESLWLVVSGAVTVLDPSTGRRAADRVAGPGEALGPPGPRGSMRNARPAWIRALVATRLLEVESRVLDRACQRDPSIATDLMDLVRIRAERAEQRLRWSLRLPAERHLHAELLDLAERFGVPLPGGGLRIAIPLTQDLLADLTGGARETVNRSLRSLAARGLVVRNGLTYTVFAPPEDAGGSDGVSAAGDRDAALFAAGFEPVDDDARLRRAAAGLAGGD
jgi:CRP-like cAMP-binding protein